MKLFEQLLSVTRRLSAHSSATEKFFSGTTDSRGCGLFSDRGVSPPPLDLHRVSAGALAKYTEFADTLKPDDIQRQHAASSNRFFPRSISLRNRRVRRRRCSRAVGEDSLRARSDQRITRTGPGLWYAPPSIQGTVTRDEQKELNVSEEQKEALAELRAYRWRALRPGEDLSRRSPEKKSRAVNRGRDRPGSREDSHVGPANEIGAAPLSAFTSLVRLVGVSWARWGSLKNRDKSTPRRASADSVAVRPSGPRRRAAQRRSHYCGGGRGQVQHRSAGILTPAAAGPSQGCHGTGSSVKPEGSGLRGADSPSSNAAL